MSDNVRTDIALISQNVSSLNNQYTGMMEKLDKLTDVVHEVVVMNHRTSALEERLIKVEKIQVVHSSRISYWMGGLAVMMIIIYPVIKHFATAPV
jgi:hypothetical protein